MRYLILIPIVFSILLSCNENEPDQASQPEKIVIDLPETQELSQMALAGDISKAWKTESFSLEVFGELDCRKDDVFTFFSDGTYEYDGGALLCGDSDNQQLVKGTWELDFDNNSLTFDKNTPKETKASLITLKEDNIRAMGKWNSLNIDARLVKN